MDAGQKLHTQYSRRYKSNYHSIQFANCNHFQADSTLLLLLHFTLSIMCHSSSIFPHNGCTVSESRRTAPAKARYIDYFPVLAIEERIVRLIKADIFIVSFVTIFIILCHVLFLVDSLNGLLFNASIGRQARYHMIPNGSNKCVKYVGACKSILPLIRYYKKICNAYSH